MKKIISALALLTFILLLVSCSFPVSDIVISSARAKEIVEDIQKNVEENEENFDKERIYIPKVLLENDFDFKQLVPKVEVREHGYYYSRFPQDYSVGDYSVGDYNVVSFGVHIFGEEMHEKFWEGDYLDEYTNKHKKGGKEFYIGDGVESPNITFSYFININTFVEVSLKRGSKVFEGLELGDCSVKEKPIPQEVANKIYDDFQMISLAELERMGRK